MAWHSTPDRWLRAQMERPGNWRMKALLAAELPECDYTAEEVGRALTDLAKSPETKEYHIGRRKRSFGPSSEPTPTIRPLNYEGEFNEPEYAKDEFKERELEAGVDLDQYMGRMLASDAGTEKDVLWREQLLDTVIEGSREAQVARDMATVIEVDTRKGDHPVAGNDIFASAVAEGAGIPFNEEDYSTNSWTTEKYGLGAYVTEELIDHALIDVIERQIRHLGRAVENQLNRVWLNNTVDNAGATDVETNAGTSAPYNTPLDALLQARNQVVGANWPTPDTMVMHDQFQLGIVAGGDATGSAANLLYSNRAGNYDAKDDLSNEYPAGLFGLENVAVVPDGPYNGSNNWGYDTDGHYGAVLYPRELNFVYIRRDLESKDFDDPIRDLSGANVRAEFDAVLGQTGAVARIKN